jgi:uncharacterized protein YvpB
MNNILLLTNNIENSPNGGRELLCKLNHDILKKLYKDNYIIYELSKTKINGFKSIINAFKGHIDGLNTIVITDIINIIKKEKIEKIFIDGSNLGGFAKIIKKKFPKIKIYTFFHNVESRFFLGSLKQTKSLHSLAVFFINYLAEKKSVQYSDNIICINIRDSELLKKVYGKSANNIYPMSLEDKMPKNYTNMPSKIQEKFILFVGGTFYANRIGILWFAKNIAPYIKYKTYIIGRGFEKYKEELEENKNIIVIGGVDSLAQWYHDAYFIIAPIFDGSGMKTKVAEALMYGKTIIGTKEAFIGYESIVSQVGTVCQTKNEFISIINNIGINDIDVFNKNLRKLYNKNYSFEAATIRLNNILMGKKTE